MSALITHIGCSRGAEVTRLPRETDVWAASSALGGSWRLRKVMPSLRALSLALPPALKKGGLVSEAPSLQTQREP